MQTASSIRNARENPSPDRYTVARDLKNHKRGKTFGISYESFRKVYMPGSNLVSVDIAKELPAVGKYDIMKEPG